MPTTLRQHLSYANVMATVAVVIALGGSSYAVATSSIGSRQLKNNAVRSTDLKHNDTRARDVRNGTLAGIDVRADALTGADVLESTLTTVPSASTAKRAHDADAAAHAAHADVATNIAAPEGFHEIGAPSEPAFNPGCTNDTANPAFQSVGFYKDCEDAVHFRGTFSCTSAGLLVFNLPPGHGPAGGKAHTQAIACFGGGNCPGSHTTLVQVIGSGFSPGSDGGVLADATTAVLDGTSFRSGS
jgi:hypothetical protein